MNNITIDHSKPHHVLLIFQVKEDAQNAALFERNNYYRELKEQGKVILSGSFWVQGKTMVIARVTCAAELEDIIGNDPGLSDDTFELVKAMAFTAEHDLAAFTPSYQYDLDQYA